MQSQHHSLGNAPLTASLNCSAQCECALAPWIKILPKIVFDVRRGSGQAE